VKWNTKRQGSRDNNINIQAEGSVHLGLGYRDVKEISRDTAMEVFESNFNKLSQAAYAVARERAEEFTSNLVEVVQERSPDALDKFQDPETQYALFSAQSGYAKTGDADLGEVLIELLMTRISAAARDTSQLASTYAITVAENLSSHHFAILTCSFVLKQLAYGGVRTVDELAREMANTVEPFAGDLKSANPVDFDYLVGLGCMILTASSSSPAKCAGFNYPGLFTRGFSPDEMPNSARLIGTPLVRPFGPDSDRYKVNALTKPELTDLIDSVVMHDMRTLAFQTLQNTVMQEYEIHRMLSQEQEGLAAVFARHSALGGNSYINTAIGTAIAHANMRRVYSSFNLPLASLLNENTSH
jgi:hypothetical protein